jgi:hypothetical protein
MDGLMCEHIRIGVMVETELNTPRTMWRRVRTMHGARVDNGTLMNFSATVLREAGGIRRFLDEWEQVDA